MKDEFLSWFSSATILAIGSNEIAQLESLKEKYFALKRIECKLNGPFYFYHILAFEQCFGYYAKNRIKGFILSPNISICDIFQEVFLIWKNSHE